MPSSKPKIIDVTISAALFRKLDPIGLLRDESAKICLEELRTRLREPFPQSQLFLRFKPTSNAPIDVFTSPRTPEHAEEVRRVAAGLVDQLTWIRYDESVRGALL